MNPFNNVVPFIDRLLADMRNSGLAGLVTKAPAHQLVEPEVAVWTGPGHQLAFLGTREDFRLELRQTDGENSWKLLRTERDPDRMPMMAINFASLEG